MLMPTPFKSKAAIANAQNLANYIFNARHVNPTYASLSSFNWSDNVWVLPRGRLRFVNLQNAGLHKSVTPSASQQLAPEFIEFAKAYIVETRRGSATKVPSKDLSIIMVVEQALIEVDGYADITRLSEQHLDRASAIIKETYVDLLGMGAALKNLVDEVTKHNITSSGIRHWQHPFRGLREPGATYDRETKLPLDETLLALAEIFANGHTGDLNDEATYITSITAIFLSAPFRINEQSWLKSVSLEEDFDTLGQPQKFLRHYSPKINKIVTKEIPQVMASHCEEAFRRLEKITEEGRKLARYYESGAKDFYPHETCPDVPPNQVLTRDQAVAALGRPTLKSAENLMKWMEGHRKLTGWTLRTLWASVVEYHKKNNPFFPYQVDPRLCSITPPKMSESLLCFREFQLADGFATSPIFLAPINGDYYNKRLSQNNVSKLNGKTYPSFLHRHGYENITLKSHQLRHFLNTAAEEAGVAIERITAWSGRASVQQSRTYMHKDPKRTAREIGDRLIPVTDTTHTPITEQEYSILGKGPHITTRYGICTHPWTVSACEKAADCLNCSELLHCKGHKNSLKAVERERAHVAENLEAALKEIEAGNRAATRWVDRHQLYLVRLDEIVAMHKNPAIPDGSPVQMVGHDFTHAKRILTTKHPELLESSGLSDVYSDDLLSCLKELMEENNDA
ncbi:hypothetical protein [Pseudomonas sp. MWU12-3103b]|uniref:hypothetical protein n=1 Tax=Pseudomonas sp. MWU12-3103b TaxID=2928857 RepID=UPI0020004677|nr:hypothetical protein [Pseudomonas sp. MWU12-3103b]